jgi:penicillin-binding protein 2
MCVIANKGYYYTPHFVRSIDNALETDTILNAYKIRHDVTKIPDTIYNIVQLGMQDVVDRGTAVGARIPGIALAGKTGTAENYGIIYGKREKLANHSWFVCFAPRENPKIAVAVVVENAGFGATWAGPMASLIVERYLKDSLPQARWKEVERIENKEILLPILKTKRNRLDSLKLKQVKKELMKKGVGLISMSAPIKKRKKITLDFHFNAIKPNHEEQFI